MEKEIELYPFQTKGSQEVMNRKRFAICDEMGLGKTRTGLSVIQQSQANDTLVLCTKNAFPTWKNQCMEWMPDMDIIYVRGTKAERREIWEQKGTDSNRRRMFITTAANMRNDWDIIPKKWDVILMDEYDRFMTNRSATWKLIKKFSSDYMVPISGSPAKKGPQSLWPMLNLLDRKTFSSYWRFVNTFCNVTDGYFGKDISGVRNVEELRDLLSSYMQRNKKKNVAPEVPLKQRHKLPVEMVPAQAKAYRQLEKDMLTIIDDEFYMAESVLDQITRMRQLLCCPKIIHPSLPYGGGIDTIIDKMETSDDKFIIYVPFISAIPFIEQALLDNGWETIVKLQGGLDVDVLDERTKLFNKTDRAVAIVSIWYAQSFELDTCQYGYFLGSAYDPGTNEQAEDRMHRLTTRWTVHCYYVLNEGTIDEGILDIVNQRNRTIDLMFMTREEARKLLNSP